MDPISVLLSHAIASALAPHIAALLVAAAIVLIAITIDEITKWFAENRAVAADSQTAIGFTIATQLGSRTYTEVKGVFRDTEAPNRIIQGIYDTQTERVLAVRKIASKKVDAEVVKHHAKGGLAIYT